MEADEPLCSPRDADSGMGCAVCLVLAMVILIWAIVIN